MGAIGFDEKKQGTERLFRLDTDHTLHSMVEEVAVSNGLAWSLDEKMMYYIDSLAHSVDAFDYEYETGEISNRRPIFNIPLEEGNPDGMCIDSEGMLWVAYFRGGKVVRINPNNGKQLGYVQVPATQVTSCAFGGRDLNKLFITTARINLKEADLKQEPLAGGLFVADLPFKGKPVTSYGG